MTYENVDIYVLSTDVPALPIEGAVVKVMSSDGKLFFSQGLTDANGKASFLLPSSMTFQLRFYKFSTSFPQPMYINVLPTPAVNIFEVLGAVYHYPEATDPRLCQASGFFRSPSGGAGTFVDMHFIAKFDPILLEGAPILTERVSTRTDDKGYASLTLIRNACYDVMIEGFEWITRSVSIPDEPWVNLGDLLFNRVKAIAFDPAVVNQELTMNVGDVLVFDVSVATMARYNLPNITTEVLWSITDPSKVGFQLSPTTLTLTALAAGTTTLNALRRDTTTIAIPDIPVLGVPVTITVV